MKRKTIFLAMLSLVALASCNKELEGGVTYSPKPNEIYFGSKSLTVETKSVTESTASVLQSNGFKAAIIIDEDDAVMFNKAVAFNDGVYTVPGETYYYPVEGTVSAYAVYPKTETIAITDGVATIDYSQNVNEDLVVAKVGGVAKQSTAINLSFAHALSQVSFKAKGSDTKANYVLKLIEVTAPNGGTYQYADGTWTDLGDATAYTAYSNTGAAVSTSAYQAFGESMTFIPGEVSLRAVWDCKNKVDDTIVGQYDQTVQATLVAGEHATLNLVLPNSDAQEIKFTISVGAWQNEEMEITVEEGCDDDRLLPGVFTVGSGKKVRFAKGNLYWNGSEFALEDNQLAYPTTWDSNHISHFYWSKDAAVARAESYDDWSSASIDDTFFAADGGAIEGLTVLTVGEWSYLLNHYLADLGSKQYQVVVNGINGYVLKPDGYTGTVKSTYTLNEWNVAETKGLVFLPSTGYRVGTNLDNAGYGANLWTATPLEYDEYSAYSTYIYNNDWGTIKYTDRWDNGYPVRLVEVEEQSDDNLLSGVFTVNNGKKVRFTKGNLFWNGSEFDIEKDQLAYPQKWHDKYVGHFFWSKDASVACESSYDDPDASTTDTFFAADGGTIEGLTVLTAGEWDYLLAHHLASRQAVINGINGCILKPDGYTGTVKSTYTLDEWADAETEGLVFLPFAGYRPGGNVNVGNGFETWTATPNKTKEGYAGIAYADESDSGITDEYSREHGYPVRLVKEVADIDTYKTIITIQPTEAGYISENTSAKTGKYAESYVLSNEGWAFDHWSDGKETAYRYDLIEDCNIPLTAYFVRQSNTNYLIGYYNVKAVGAIKILDKITSVYRMSIDGGEMISPAENYTFSTTGEHYVTFYLKDDTTSLNSMFNACTSLVRVDGTHLDAHRIKHAYRMFNDCSALKSIDGIQDWDFSQIGINDVPPEYFVMVMGGVSTQTMFQSCSALQQIIIPNKCREIGKFMFNHCSSNTVTDIHIPASVQKVGGTHCFYDCGPIERFTVDPASTTFKSVNGMLMSIDGTKLYSVPANLQVNNSTLELPEGLTAIGELSFQREWTFSKLILPDSYVLNEYCCGDMNEGINYGNSLSVAIYSYTTIKEYAVKDSNPNYMSYDGCIYSKDGSTLVAVPTNKPGVINIKDGCTTIKREAIWESAMGVTSGNALTSTITGIHIPASVTSIYSGQITGYNKMVDSKGWIITVDPANPVYTVSAGKLVVK